MLHTLWLHYIVTLFTGLVMASCAAPSRMPAVPREMRDRAYTSPIWYTPDR